MGGIQTILRFSVSSLHPSCHNGFVFIALRFWFVHVDKAVLLSGCFIVGSRM